MAPAPRESSIKTGNISGFSRGRRDRRRTAESPGCLRRLIGATAAWQTLNPPTRRFTKGTGSESSRRHTLRENSLTSSQSGSPCRDRCGFRGERLGGGAALDHDHRQGSAGMDITQGPMNCPNGTSRGGRSRIPPAQVGASRPKPRFARPWSRRLASAGNQFQASRSRPGPGWSGLLPVAWGDPEAFLRSAWSRYRRADAFEHPNGISVLGWLVHSSLVLTATSRPAPAEGMYSRCSSSSR